MVKVELQQTSPLESPDCNTGNRDKDIKVILYVNLPYRSIRNTANIPMARQRPNVA